MKIKTLKEVESNFEILSHEEKAAMLGGTGIYSPTDTTQYLGDMDFTYSGYITYFEDQGTGNSGGYAVTYQPGIEGSPSGIGDYQNNRFELLYVTEDFKGFYVDNLTGGYFLDRYNESFIFDYSAPSSQPGYDTVTAYYDEFTSGYVYFYSIY